MWTYLLIFFSLATILSIFLNRLVIHIHRKNNPIENKEELENFEKNLNEEQEKVSKSEKNKTEELYKRGIAFLQQDKEEEAIKYFIQALTINKNHPESQKSLADLYLKKEMYSSAAALFEQLGLSTEDAVHYSHLGYALYKQADFKSALKAYQKAITLDDSRPKRFISLAQVYRGLGLIHHAIIAVNKALDLENKLKQDSSEKSNLDTAYLFVDLQMELGNFEKAKNFLEKILENNPEYSEVKKMVSELQNLKSE